MYIGRKGDGSIYGLWTQKQFDGQEQLLDNHPEVVAFQVPIPLQKRLELEDIVQVLKDSDSKLATALDDKLASKT